VSELTVEDIVDVMTMSETAENTDVNFVDTIVDGMIEHNTETTVENVTDNNTETTAEFVAKKPELTRHVSKSRYENMPVSRPFLISSETVELFYRYFYDVNINELDSADPEKLDQIDLACAEYYNPYMYSSSFIFDIADATASTDDELLTHGDDEFFSQEEFESFNARFQAETTGIELQDCAELLPLSIYYGAGRKDCLTEAPASVASVAADTLVDAVKAAAEKTPARATCDDFALSLCLILHPDA
jgi:hypothetical protein